MRTFSVAARARTHSKKVAHMRSSIRAILNALVHVWSTAPAIPGEVQWWLHPM
jgi:hypothetical protein